MGRLVQLWKAEESPDAVVYFYGPSREKSGRLRLSKLDKVVSRIEPVPEVTETEDAFFYRDLATVKLQMLATEDTFPDETYIGT